MKKLSFFALAIAGMLFTACSDKDVAVADGPQGESLPEGYMALNINLPTTPIVRAANDDFDDGLPEEYKVTDCALLLFQGENNKSEDEAQLLSAQAIVLPFDSEEEGDSEGNITTTYQATAKVEDFNNNGQYKLYALALLNYKEVMSIDNGTPTFKNVHIKKEGETTTSLGTVTVNKKSPLSAIRELITEANLTTRGGSTNYFFMTNAVLYKDVTNFTNPSGINVIQLAEMDRTKIKEKMEDAKLDPAGEIFVERAVAKATLKVKGLGSTDNPATVTDLPIESVEWIIDNMEPATYVTRNPGKYSTTAAENTMDYIGFSSGYFKTTPNYRFVGNTTLYGGTTLGKTTDEKQLYRTYWCIDPQYSSDATGMLAAPQNDEKETIFSPVGDNYPLYCYENTFDVNHQNYKNTTRAILKVTLKEGKTFYTLNGGQERYIDDKAEDMEDGETPKTGKEKATSHVVSYIVNKSDVLAAFKNALNKNQEWDVNEESVDVDYKRDEVNGQLKVISIKISKKVEDAIEEGTIFKSNAKQLIENAFTQELIKEINKEYVVREYLDGVMYYEARFKHFADVVQENGLPSINELAPWNIKTTDTYTNDWEGVVSSGGIDNSYPAGKDGKSAAENYLGRYGMVRNNWYEVEVTAFLKLGYPADPSGKVNNPDFDEPDTPDTPDDNIQDYISAKIHVLSWAKRTQSWGF